MEKSIFEKINDDLPIYFNDMIERFNLKIVKIDKLSSALIGETYLIVIFIDKFTISMSYITKDSDGNLVKYACESFFAEKCDECDRKNIQESKKAGDEVISVIVIMSSCMITKWANVLKGDKDWIIDCKNSKWFYERKINVEERKLCNKYL